MDFKKITTGQLLLILGLIILLVPPILVLPSLYQNFDFSNSGQIGDTIGGLTSPFINAIAAVLVFIAFKEQVKANELLQEQQYFQHIQEQIHRLENDFLNFPIVIDGIITDIIDSSYSLDHYDEEKQDSYRINAENLNKAIYVTALFQQTFDLIEQMKSNKVFMHRKLRALYVIIYQDKFTSVDSKLKSVINLGSTTKNYETELLFQIQDLKNKFTL